MKAHSMTTMASAGQAAARKTSRWALVGLALLSGVLLPLALPNEVFGLIASAFGVQAHGSFYWGNTVLGLVAIAPVLYAACRAPSFRFASLLGVLFGALSTLLANFWLMFFQGYSIWTMGGVVIGYVGFNALLFPFLRGFGGIETRLRPFLLAAAWAAYEYFKSIGFLGYPWGLIAYPLADILPLVQFVDITGVWGLSFLAALANALVAEAVHLLAGTARGWARGRAMLGRQALVGAVLAAACLAYGFVRLALPIPSQGSARLLLVQQNIDPWEEGRARTDSTQINQDMTVAAVRSAAVPPDLAVWSESSVPDVWFTSQDWFNRRQASRVMEPFARDAGVPVLFGGVGVKDYKKAEFHNAAALMSPEGRIVDTYAKMHPVPFAESIPFFEKPVVRGFFENVIGIQLPWVMGTRSTIFRVSLRAGGELAFGVPICFEDAFSDLCRGFVRRGAQMLVNITNDSWSKTWSAEIQHFAVARLRAVENRRVLVRSANGGVSAVIDPWGRILSRLPLFVRTTAITDVPLYQPDRWTVYTRFGDWFPRLLIGLLLVALVWDMVRGRSAGARRRK
jgi:apolipoprotein N-acyltransferase